MKKIVIIFAICIIGNVVVCFFLNKKEIKLGGEYTYLHDAKGIVTEVIDEDQVAVKIYLDNENEGMFLTEHLVLDCSRVTIDTKNISEGDNIRFYFLKDAIDENLVKVDKIYMMDEEGM